MVSALIRDIGPEYASLAAKLAQNYKNVTVPKEPDPIPVEFGEWLPDLPEYANPGSLVANNVIPDRASYRPFREPLPIGQALESRVLAGVPARAVTGENYNYAGTAAKLYEMRSGIPTDRSKAGGYSTADGETWEFASFDKSLIATNYSDPVQSNGIGATGNFADLITGTSKPQFRHIAVIREFLVGGNVIEATAGTVPNRVWWSAYNNPVSFDPDAATQCGFSDRPDASAVRKVVGGVSYGLIFLQGRIDRMTYAGPPRVWQFDAIDRKRGTNIPNSVIGFGRMVYFISDEGFFVNDGTQSYSIGQNKVDRYFERIFPSDSAALVSAAIDPINKLVAWAIPTKGNLQIPNKIMIYNWEDNQFSEVDVDLDVLVNAASEARTLESFDELTLDPAADTTLSAPVTGGATVIPVTDIQDFKVGNHVRITLDDTNIHQSPIADVQAGQLTIQTGVPSAAAAGNRAVRTSIDVFTDVSLDNPLWLGGKINFGAYESAHRQAFFNGPTLRATIETQERQLFPGRVGTVHKARPLVDGPGALCSLRSRNRLQDDFSLTGPKSVDTVGEAGFLDEAGQQEARYHSMVVEMPAGSDWEHAQGVEFIGEPGGSV